MRTRSVLLILLVLFIASSSMAMEQLPPNPFNDPIFLDVFIEELQPNPFRRLFEQWNQEFIDYFHEDPRSAIQEVVEDIIDRRLEALEGTRYQLVETHNTRTFLQIDTATGRIWQVHFSTSDGDSFGRVPLNDRSMVGEGEPLWPGRFILHPTQNIWNFILLDQNDGRVWQVQFSMEDDDYRFIRRIWDVH